MTYGAIKNNTMRHVFSHFLLLQSQQKRKGDYMKKKYYILLLTLTILTMESSSLHLNTKFSEEISIASNSIIHINTAIPAPSSDNLPGYGS